MVELIASDLQEWAAVVLDDYEVIKGMRARGNLAVQIRDLSDGARIRYQIAE